MFARRRVDNQLIKVVGVGIVGSAIVMGWSGANWSERLDH